MLDRPESLSDSEIHVWCTSLELSGPELDRLLLLLSTDEKTRAERFYFARDRNRFIAGRGLLRLMLGSYLGKDAAQIDFVYGKQGKPGLRPALQGKNLQFNLSHSNGLAIYGFSWGRRLGVDIEFMKSMADMDEFSRHSFSPEEATYINSLSGKQKEAAFFKTWTCKEAFLKASGTGLTVPLNQVQISLVGIDEEFTLSTIGSDQEHPVLWRIKVFQPFPGYQAALAFEGSDGQVVFRK